MENPTFCNSTFCYFYLLIVLPFWKVPFWILPFGILHFGILPFGILPFVLDPIWWWYKANSFTSKLFNHLLGIMGLLKLTYYSRVFWLSLYVSLFLKSTHKLYLKEEDWKQFKRAFNLIDEDKSGKLNMAEMDQLIRRFRNEIQLV